jgi:SAM-dependent methyltransferase
VNRRGRTDWDIYLARFHQDRPGITETILTRCTHQGQNPYEWLTEGLTTSGVTLDLACGSAPTRPRIGSGWLGIDASEAELHAAELDSTGRAVRGDLAQLPFRDASCHNVICSMALMLIAPLDQALREIRRVVEPEGSLRILLPATRPLTVPDRIRYARLGLALRTAGLFPPTRLTNHAQAALQSVGLQINTDDSRRFAFSIASPDDAALLIESLYLPTATDPRRANAKRLAAAWTGHDVGIPLRLITARPRR